MRIAQWVREIRRRRRHRRGEGPRRRHVRGPVGSPQAARTTVVGPTQVPHRAPASLGTGEGLGRRLVVRRLVVPRGGLTVESLLRRGVSIRVLALVRGGGPVLEQALPVLRVEVLLVLLGRGLGACRAPTRPQEVDQGGTRGQQQEQAQNQQQPVPPFVAELRVVAARARLGGAEEVGSAGGVKGCKTVWCGVCVCLCALLL